jgi:hypothetical protein
MRWQGATTRTRARPGWFERADAAGTSAMPPCCRLAAGNSIDALQPAFERSQFGRGERESPSVFKQLMCACVRVEQVALTRAACSTCSRPSERLAIASLSASSWRSLARTERRRVAQRHESKPPPTIEPKPPTIRVASAPELPSTRQVRGRAHYICSVPTTRPHLRRALPVATLRASLSILRMC